MNVRPPAVAGTFYPADCERLSSSIEKFMGGTLPRPRHSVAPKALIVPHAGYRFSGAIAASGYACLGPQVNRIKRVVLLGPAHKVPIRGLALPSVELFETPLGRVTLDTDNLNILKTRPYTQISDDAHAKEHSLEVHIPFLQKILGNFVLTPVVVGGADIKVVEDALRCLWGNDETLIVISSDLSHYHAYGEAQSRDIATSRHIMSLSMDRLRSQNACGWRPVNGLIRCARRMHLHPTTLDIRNSGDTTQSRERVVGYGAWSFSSDEEPANAPLDDNNRRELLRVASKVVRSSAEGKRFPIVHVGSFAAALQGIGASFVTLSKKDRLRGCLGTLHAYRPLILDVAERAYATTVKDPRFTPVKREELPGMHLEVSVLSPPKTLQFHSEADLLEQLRPGMDGLIIEDEGKRATFLPKVWNEIKERRLFLGRLKQKAGLAPAHWSDTFKAWRYTTQTIGTTLSN